METNFKIMIGTRYILLLQGKFCIFKKIYNRNNIKHLKIPCIFIYIFYLSFFIYVLNKLNP